jgi:hypothetical protein
MRTDGLRLDWDKKQQGIGQNSGDGRRTAGAAHTKVTSATHATRRDRQGHDMEFCHRRSWKKRRQRIKRAAARRRCGAPSVEHGVVHMHLFVMRATHAMAGWTVRAACCPSENPPTGPGWVSLWVPQVIPLPWACMCAHLICSACSKINTKKKKKKKKNSSNMRA